jgi:hypothetical protein
MLANPFRYHIIFSNVDQCSINVGFLLATCIVVKLKKETTVSSNVECSIKVRYMHHTYIAY